MVETDKAYLAALIDGEGHIGASNGVGYNMLVLQVTNYDKDVLDWACNITGLGTVRRSNKTLWRWCTSGRQTKQVLAMVFPYMRIKREHGFIAAQWPCIGQGKRPGDGVRELQAEVSKYLKALNSYGRREYNRAQST